MSKKNKPAGQQIVPLRVPEDMRLKIRKVSDQARLSDADIMRLAIERGLDAVERMFEAQPRKAA